MSGQDFKSHSELTDLDFVKQFSETSLPASLFTHEAHIRLAWIHIKKYGLLEAERNVSMQLKNYVKSLGAEDKYHETLTIAGIKAVNHFLMQSETKSFSAFIKENGILLSDFKQLIQSHYSTNIFNSKPAKLKYLELELIPFSK